MVLFKPIILQVLQVSDIQLMFQDFEKTALELREQVLPNL